MDIEHSHDDEHARHPGWEEVVAKQPRHSLASVGGEPGMWTTWEDVPLVLKIVELAEVLRVSRATAYAAAKDGSIPSFRVRGALRCTRPVAWAVANGLNPWDYVGQNPFSAADPEAVVSLNTSRWTGSRRRVFSYGRSAMIGSAANASVSAVCSSLRVSISWRT